MECQQMQMDIIVLQINSIRILRKRGIIKVTSEQSILHIVRLKAQETNKKTNCTHIFYVNTYVFTLTWVSFANPTLLTFNYGAHQ